MPAFSNKSKTMLATCHPDIQRVFNEVIKHWDCIVIEGARPLSRQQMLYRQGRDANGKVVDPKLVVTNVDGIKVKGKHNYTPSKAIDIAPFPLDWNDTARFHYFAGFVIGIATSMGIRLRHGGDWNGNRNPHDEKLKDLPHFEIVEP